MSRIHRTALAVSSAALCAALTTSCSALHEAPITNAKANNNPAIEKVNAHSGVAQQADSLAKQAARDKAEKAAAKQAEENKKAASKKTVSSKKAKSDPVGTRNDMEPVSSPPDVPAWVTATNWAQTKLGHEYVWGGESDAEGGFDCSGLMQAAYAQAGVKLPRVAQDQYHASDVHPKRSELTMGDLVFYGTSSNIHHVGLYVGSGMMLHAPNSDSVIRFDRIDYMSDYYGATRVSQ